MTLQGKFGADDGAPGRPQAWQWAFLAAGSFTVFLAGMMLSFRSLKGRQANEWARDETYLLVYLFPRLLI